MKNTITTALVAIISGVMMMQAVALMTLPERNKVTYTDYNDHSASEQISVEWEVKAKAEWIEENGEWQPNLDADTEKYLRKTTALLQEQRNAKSKTR
jgi:putative lipoprotein|nr:MAG TPA: hypothetical protein [Caudoviricetes sp.]